MIKLALKTDDKSVREKLTKNLAPYFEIVDGNYIHDRNILHLEVDEDISVLKFHKPFLEKDIEYKNLTGKDFYFLVFDLIDQCCLNKLCSFYSSLLNANIVGSYYLKHAIIICKLVPDYRVKDIYEIVGIMLSVNPKNVERTIRFLIYKENKRINKCFENCFTNSEYIYMLSSLLDNF